MHGVAPELKNESMSIEIHGSADCMWRYQVARSDQAYDIAAPTFEIDGVEQPAALSEVVLAAPPERLANGCTEHRYAGRFLAHPELELRLIFRIGQESPIVRFRYSLASLGGHALTKAAGHDRLVYFRAPFAGMREIQEIRFSEFRKQVHSFCLSERPVEPRMFENGLSLAGPMLVGSGEDRAFLVAYEHGSPVQDAFLEFCLMEDRSVALRAARGNYVHPQPLGTPGAFRSIWMQAGAVAGPAGRLAAAYRAFVLRDMSTSGESRAPYIFYNTWALQERSKWWHGGKYLDPMRQERVLREIDAAHRLGVEVFVVDTGWYAKTGDWQVNTERFPDGLRTVGEALRARGMRLGLWFGPTSAALSSRALAENRGCAMSWHGQDLPPHPVWETEESQIMCLVSPYSDVFVETLIRLARELGVSYFKLDNVAPHGCDSPNHWHGTMANSAEERAESYAFQIALQVARMIERLCEAIPTAIVEFDVTEDDRIMGLAILSAGKYIGANNGPYYQSYDIPVDPVTQNTNMLFFPGQARGWACRATLDSDKWLPSTLFLTHYLPDDPEQSQILNVASLILGHNGVWGDLLAVSEEGIGRVRALIDLYKQVRDEVTASSPVRSGTIGGNPEIHEKIDGATGRGVVVVFATAAGRYSYVTAGRVAPTRWATAGTVVTVDPRGRAVLQLPFDKPGAAIVFFGVA